MNIFVKKNWYHFDLNKQILNNLKSHSKNENKYFIKERMEKDFKLKIKLKLA